MTKEKYEESVYKNIDHLPQRRKRLSEKAQAVKRTYIARLNETLRSLGIPV